MIRPALASFIIRPAVASDAGAITRIYAAAVAEDTATFELEAPDEAQMAGRLSAILALGHPYFVAERGRAVIGFAYASTFRARAAFAATLEDSVYVDQLARGAGAGAALLDAVIAAAAERGFEQMIAVIGDSRTRAQSEALHARAGFAVKGTLNAVGRKHGRLLDVVFMQRALSRS
jgi:L-amino acid N-acyltransferase YncA